MSRAIKRSRPKKPNSVATRSGVGFVYVLAVPSLNVCKIGFTHKPLKRFSKIRSSLRLHSGEAGAIAYQVRLLKRGTMAEEQAAHTLLAPYRAEMPAGTTGKTEWYRYCEPVEAWIKLCLAV